MSLKRACNSFAVRPRLNLQLAFGSLGSVPPKRLLSSNNDGMKNNVDVKDFQLEKAVLMRKITRYEYEKQWRSNCSEEELKAYVSDP